MLIVLTGALVRLTGSGLGCPTWPRCTDRELTTICDVDKRSGTTEATVREWHAEHGWGVLDSPCTPGGCWAHFSHLDMPGYRALNPGQEVRLDWETAEQDSYNYRATRIVP
jgi:CspA family cold shock protein